MSDIMKTAELENLIRSPLDLVDSLQYVIAVPTAVSCASDLREIEKIIEHIELRREAEARFERFSDGLSGRNEEAVK